MADKCFEPKWEGVFVGWTKQYVKQNLWRIRHLYDYDDAIQECALVFSDCVNAYKDKVDNAAWFMSLYKTSVVNKFYDFANKSTQARETEAAYAEVFRPNSSTMSEGPLLAAFSSASDELKTVLAALASAPAEFLSMMLNVTDKEHWNRRLLRLAGIYDMSADVIGELRQLLTER